MCGLAQGGGVGDAGFALLAIGVGLLVAGVGLLVAGVGLLVAGVGLLVGAELYFKQAFSAPLGFSWANIGISERIAIIRQTTGTGNEQLTSAL